MDVLPYFKIKKPDVVHETIDGETVIVNLENGVYYSLRFSGVEVWNRLESGANADEIVELLQHRYGGSPDTIREAIDELLLKLQEEGLVRALATKPNGDAAPTPAPKGVKKDFEAPVLEKYSDMQELLLLDPIHEVDEEGWPHKAEADGGGDAVPG